MLNRKYKKAIKRINDRIEYYSDRAKIYREYLRENVSEELKGFYNEQILINESCQKALESVLCDIRRH